MRTRKLMFLQINPSLRLPIYAQIVEQIKLSLASGTVGTGERLPSIRELAVELRVNPNTVAKAYSELEREGVVNKVRGKGVYVSERNDVFAEKEKKRIVAQRLRQALVDAYHLGVDTDKARRILDEEIIKFKKERSR